MPPHFQMAMKPCSIKKIDCLTVSMEDFGVNSKFEFKSIITGDFCGVAIWFNSEFDTDTGVITLATGPEDPYVHFLVFYYVILMQLVTVKHIGVKLYYILPTRFLFLKINLFVEKFLFNVLHIIIEY